MLLVQRTIRSLSLTSLAPDSPDFLPPPLLVTHCCNWLSIGICRLLPRPFQPSRLTCRPLSLVSPRSGALLNLFPAPPTSTRHSRRSPSLAVLVARRYSLWLSHRTHPTRSSLFRSLPRPPHFNSPFLVARVLPPPLPITYHTPLPLPTTSLPYPWI